MEINLFWIFIAVVWYCDHKQHMADQDIAFFKHKIDEEKALRKKQVEGTDNGV